nr:hypothetical protein Iba_chr02bCG7880 [Ipomoea batatas]
MGNDELIGLIDEAKREVGLYFENAFKEQHECDNVEDLAHKATAFFIEKLVEDRKVVDGPEEMGSCSKFKYSKVYELKGVVNDPEREKTDLGYKGSDVEESVEVQRGVELEKEEDVMQMLSGQGSSDAVIKSQNDGPWWPRSCDAQLLLPTTSRIRLQYRNLPHGICTLGATNAASPYPPCNGTQPIGGAINYPTGSLEHPLGRALKRMRDITLTYCPTVGGNGHQDMAPRRLSQSCKRSAPESLLKPVGQLFGNRVKGYRFPEAQGRRAPAAGHWKERGRSARDNNGKVSYSDPVPSLPSLDTDTETTDSVWNPPKLMDGCVSMIVRPKKPPQHHTAGHRNPGYDLILRDLIMWALDEV